MTMTMTMTTTTTTMTMPMGRGRGRGRGRGWGRGRSRSWNLPGAGKVKNDWLRQPCLVGYWTKCLWLCVQGDEGGERVPALRPGDGQREETRHTHECHSLLQLQVEGPLYYLEWKPPVAMLQFLLFRLPNTRVFRITGSRISGQMFLFLFLPIIVSQYFKKWLHTLNF